MNKMTEGNNYNITNSKGVSCKAELVSIMRYGASGMGSDYFFKPLKGEKSFMSLNSNGNFPLPEMIVQKFVKEI